MNTLAINGTLQVQGNIVPNINGGFGKDKKAMLAKHIADIHGKELKFVNQTINRNRDRFRDNIDIIDIKGTEFEVAVSNHGIFNQNSINRAKNIYLLSERGYAKLIKLFDDDKSWELYDIMLDEYFDLRDANITPVDNTPMSPAEVMMVYAQQFLEQEKRLNEVDNKVVQIQDHLTKSPDRKTIQRDINAYARRNEMNQQEVRMMIYNKIEDIHGIDVMQRVVNARKNIQEERVKEGKKPYAKSTLERKVNGMDIIAELDLMGEVMKILAGSID